MGRGIDTRGGFMLLGDMPRPRTPTLLPTRRAAATEAPESGADRSDCCTHQFAIAIETDGPHVSFAECSAVES